ncbi:MAG: sigma-70 family RNA polymerase sigma factor [Solirubrobacteraceae bacterium]
MQALATPVARPTNILPWSRLGDESLARRAAAGNAAAFEALYERYYGPLLGYTRSILLDVEDARDATQTALEKALRALPGREQDRPLRPWLYRIAHNEAIAIVRRRRPQTEITPALEPAVPGADVDAEQRGRLSQLVDDLHALPERQRGALVMRELSGLSYGEIGTALDLSIEAARRAVFDARSSLHAAADGRATACVTVRHCISDGDRRALRARGIRAHLRSCDDCASFRRSIDARSTDLHAFAPWVSGAAVIGVLGSGIGGSALLAGGGTSVATGGGIGWASMPFAIKGVALAAALATTGTAAVEIKRVTEPQRSAPVAKAAPQSSARADAQAMHAATQATRSAARTSPAPATAVDGLSVTEKTRPGAGSASGKDAPVPVVVAPQPAPRVAAPSGSAPAAKLTPEEQAASKLRPMTDRVQQVLLDAKTLASNGTQGALALASDLLNRSLAPLFESINRVLEPLGLTLPSFGSSSANPTQTAILGSVQSLLDGVQALLARLLGQP